MVNTLIDMPYSTLFFPPLFLLKDLSIAIDLILSYVSESNVCLKFLLRSSKFFSSVHTCHLSSTMFVRVVMFNFVTEPKEITDKTKSKLP